MAIKTGFPGHILAITPSDTDVYTMFSYLRVEGAGDVVVRGTQSASPTVSLAATAGEYIPFKGGTIMATGTTATGLVLFG